MLQRGKLRTAFSAALGSREPAGDRCQGGPGSLVKLARRRAPGNAAAAVVISGDAKVQISNGGGDRGIVVFSWLSWRMRRPRSRQFSAPSAMPIAAQLDERAEPTSSPRMSRWPRTSSTVNAATVAANLVSVSSDGSTFVFKSPAGALSQLKAGKVMLLQGYTVAVVVSVSHSGSRLTVTTRPAALTDIFKTADITFSEPIDFSNVFGTLASGSSPSDASSEARSLEPQVALVTSGKPVIPDVGLSYVGKATKNDFSYRDLGDPHPVPTQVGNTGMRRSVLHHGSIVRAR